MSNLQCVAICSLALALLGGTPLRADPRLVADIDEATTPPAIDGDLRDWAQARWLRFAPGAPNVSKGFYSHLVDDGPTEPPGTALTPADLSGAFALQWDDHWLYLAARVIDNVHDVSKKGLPEQWYLRDSVSLFLDIPLDGDGGAYIPGDHVFSFVADPTYPENGRWWRHGEVSGEKETPAPPQTRLAVRLGERGDYTLEAAIPMAALTRLTPSFRPPFAGRMVGFQVLVVDRDGGPISPVSQLSYGGDDDDDATWARLRFQPALARPVLSSVSPALARLSFHLPPAQKVTFAEVYGRKLVPLLKQHGLEEAREEGRVTPDSVFSRLFTVSRPAEVLWKWVEVQTDSAWPGIERELGSAAGLADSLLGAEFRIYTGRGPGQVVRQGPGKVQKGGWKRGQWQSFGLRLPMATNTLLQDREGNLWAGTAGGGVSWYDGQGFTTFPLEGYLASETVNTILEDRQGQLWFGTAGRGVNRYDGSQIKSYTTQDGLPSNSVSSMVEDRQGQLWFGTDRGVSRYDGSQFKSYTTQDGLADDAVASIAEDRQGQLWFGTLGGGLSRYDGQQFKSFTTQDGLANPLVVAVMEDRQGNLWYGTWGGGLGRYDGSGFKRYTTQDGLMSNERAWPLLEDRQGQLWFGTWGGGVSRYDGSRFRTFAREDGLASKSVSSMVEDWEGDLWFATDGGVSQYDSLGFTPLPGWDERILGKVAAMLEDRQGGIWFGTEEGGAIRYDGQQFTIYTQEDGLGYNTVIALLEDRQGDLWFGTKGGGVTCYDGQQFKRFTSEDGLVNNRVSAVLEDRKGQLWFGTPDGVSRYDGQEFCTFTTADGLGGNCVTALAQDQAGNVWVGTERGGLSRYDGQGFQRFTTREGLIDNRVLSLAQDRQGRLWAGTAAGVSRYDGKGFTSFTSRDGLADNRVTAIREDQAGRLWLGTPRGASCYDGQVFQNLGIQDGLASKEVRALLPARPGEVWIAATGGVTPYAPRRAAPPIRLKEVIADRSYGAVKELRLPSSQSRLIFAFQSVGLKTRVGQMAYVYRLAGYDPDWRVTHEPRVEYQHLPIGEYTFEVKAVDRDLNYSETPAVVRVAIHLPYGQVALIGGLGLALVGLVITSGYAIKRRRERDQAREGLMQEMEAELQTAHDLQVGLMPKEPPRIQGFEITGRCTPANHVGGDLFQYFHQDRKLTIGMADVTGHAMEAAIPVVMFSGVLKTEIKHEARLETLFVSLNQTLCEALDRHTFICLAMGELDPFTRLFRFSNSGCPYPYHYQAATGEMVELQVDAYPLGIRPDTTYPVIEVQLEPGDRVVFCSDGIIETENAQGELFGFEQTAALIRKGCREDLPAEALLERLMAEVTTFRGAVPQGDDQTVVVLKVER